ncbi:MAG: ParA family protein [Pseudomonadota bacterium]
MAVVAVFNQKGGVGKTTTTLNVAAALLMLERQPILIDLDPQAHLSLALGLKSLPGDVCASAYFLHDKPLAQLVRQLPGGLRIIPGHPDLAKVDSMLGGVKGVAAKLRTGLNQLGGGNSPVLMDCAPALSVLTLNALFAADRVLIPVTSDFLAMQGLHRTEIALRVLEKPLGRPIERRMVVTRYAEDKPQCREALATLKQRYQHELTEAKIADDLALAESPAHGMDIFAYAADSTGAHDYRVLTMELLSKGFFE